MIRKGLAILLLAAPALWAAPLIEEAPKPVEAPKPPDAAKPPAPAPAVPAAPKEDPKAEEPKASEPEVRLRDLPAVHKDSKSIEAPSVRIPAGIRVVGWYGGVEDKITVVVERWNGTGWEKDRGSNVKEGEPIGRLYPAEPAKGARPAKPERDFRTAWILDHIEVEQEPREVELPDPKKPGQRRKVTLNKGTKVAYLRHAWAPHPKDPSAPLEGTLVEEQPADLPPEPLETERPANK